MIIEIPVDEIVQDVDSLNFMELTCLIKFLDEYIDKLKYERAYEEDALSDKQRNKISRKIKEAENIKAKLEKIWKSLIIIR